MNRGPQEKALEYLVSAQQSDGGYLSFSSHRKDQFEPVYTYHTTFAPALILSSLCHTDLPKAQTLRNTIAAFLLKKRSKHWSFNYWSGGEELTTRPFPDDLDDTFCALSGLWLHDSSLVDEAALAHIVKILLATESEVGGPYRTWLVSPDSPAAWLDVDIAVNANVAYFLSLAVNPLPNVTKLLERAIKEQGFHSPYYQSEYPVIYFIARAYKGTLQPSLIHALLSKLAPNNSWGSPLHTALAISSLYYLNYPVPHHAVESLLSSQNTDGSWDAEAFCIDPKRDQMTFYNGAAALTTGFALEALTLYERQQTKPKLSIVDTVPGLLSAVSKTALSNVQMLEPSVREMMLPVLRRTLAGKNAKEILLLPELFYESLATKKPLPENTIVNLSLANLFGWVAYTLYDDVLDGDVDGHSIPSANIAMRRSLQLFEQATPRAKGFHQYIQYVFEAMDNANAWEVANCRLTIENETIRITALPEYLALDRLAERSLGHTLTPLGVLAVMGVDMHSAPTQNLQQALHHYLIARQLNDDAHDWKEDLQHGRITYVVARILRQLGIEEGTYQLDDLVTQAGQRFWHYTLRDVCYKISRHTRLSREALKKSELLLPGNIVELLLNDIDATVTKTFATVDQANRFLEAYKKDTT